MSRFNRDRNFGGRRGDRRSSSRDFTMFKTTCDECGKTCEVPFKPTGDKPVYCSECFEKHGGNERRSQDSSRRNFASSRFDSKRMFSAVCDNCGKTCQVPFKPSNDKPIYCDDCFRNKGNAPKEKAVSYYEQFESLNKKLDAIIEILNTKKTVRVVKSEIKKETIEPKETKKAEPKAKTTKKTVTKKKTTTTKKK